MLRVILSINGPSSSQDVEIPDGSAVTVGRTSASSIIVPDDQGLSKRHATFQVASGRAILIDEGSTNGTMLNGDRVSEAPVADGDIVTIGNGTTVKIQFQTSAPEIEGKTEADGTSPMAAHDPVKLWKFVVPAVALALLVLSGMAYGLYRFTQKAQEPTSSVEERIDTPPEISSDASRESSSPAAVASPTEVASPAPAPINESSVLSSDFSPEALPDEPQTELATRKLYRNMSEGEKTEFIKQRAQHIAIMMGKRPYAFTPQTIVQIRFWLDAFARRVGNKRTGLWGGDTIAILDRGKVHAPVIIRAFKQYGVPYVVGLYIPFIETEFTNISSNNVAGAAGLFQFLGPTAEGYGVPASERTNVAKMAPAAARYFRDNILSFGDDSMSVALSIAGYNRAPESVKRDLRNVLNAPNNEDKERSFWTLIANQGKLDEYFQRENVNYVPRFFAAAILGETPWAFGIDMRPLSTYTTAETEAEAAR